MSKQALDVTNFNDSPGLTAGRGLKQHRPGQSDFGKIVFSAAISRGLIEDRKSVV